MAIATAGVLAAAAGLNAWVVLLLLGALARFGRDIVVTPALAEITSGGMLALFALMLGLEMVLGKLPRFTRRFQLWDRVLYPVAGGIAFAAVPNPVVETALPLGMVAGAAVALATNLLRGQAQRALVPSMRDLAGLFTGIVASAAAAVLVPVALRAPWVAALITGGGVALLVWELVLVPLVRRGHGE